MAIEEVDLIWRFSTKSGSAGDTTAGTPAGSLGKYVSTTVVNLTQTLENVFPTLTGQQTTDGVTEYRCVFLLNNNGTLTWADVVAWIVSQVPGGATLAIGLDPAGVTPKGQAAAQAAEIANGTTAPAGVTFSEPASKAAGLPVGNVEPGRVFALWLRRTTPPGTSAMSSDGATPRVEGDTPA